ncbi:MAG: DUF742 domain-containing protein [Acidimicrobiales bacterium]
MTGRYDSDDVGLEDNVVRPFILTRGRTRASVDVVMESLVDRADLNGRSQAPLDATHRKIWELLASMMSAAEISALLHLPLGVVLVLVSDMAELGLVRVHQTAAADDIQLVRRLIDGVSAL